MNILDFVLRSDYAPMWIWGLPGLNCLVQAWYRFLWWRRVQHMAHTLALVVFFLLLGVAFVVAGLMSSERAIIDFDWLLPFALAAWLLMQIVLLVANILLALKLRRVDRERDE